MWQAQAQAGRVQKANKANQRQGGSLWSVARVFLEVSGTSGPGACLTTTTRRRRQHRLHGAQRCMARVRGVSCLLTGVPQMLPPQADLYAAARDGNVELVLQLLAKGANVAYSREVC